MEFAHLMKFSLPVQASIVRFSRRPGFLVIFWLFLLCTPLPALQSGNFTYSTTGSAVTITGYTGPGGSVNIPATIAGVPVRAIGSSAFEKKSSITNVTIPPGVTSIGSGAFERCLVLKGVTLPPGVTTIGSNAFSYCWMLVNITIPSSVTGIGRYAFDSCTGLTAVTIQSGVKGIDSGAFYRCTGLKTVTIPSSVSSIGDYAFASCRTLTSLSIQSGVTSIGNEAFSGCTGLTSVTIPASVTSIGSYAFSFCSSLAAIAVSTANTAYSGTNGVLFNKAQTTLIQFPGAFKEGYAIPSGVTTIGSGAFRSCTGLKNIAIPASVASIGSDAFTGCSSLTAFTVSSANTKYSDAGGVLLDKTKTNLIRFPGGRTGGYTIPSGVTGIGSSAFSWCSGLTSVTIPSGVTKIDSEAFYRCIGLTSVIFPPSVMSIGMLAFSDCSELAVATFEGHAPTEFSLLAFDSAAPGFTIRFYAAAAGFTTPKWKGHATVAVANPNLPEISLRVRSNGDLEITFTGVLQFSPNLVAVSWQDLMPVPASPYVVPKTGLIGSGYFRARSQAGVP